MRRLVLGRRCDACLLQDVEAPWSALNRWCGACAQERTVGRSGPCPRCTRPRHYATGLCLACDALPNGWIAVVLLAPDDDRERTVWRVRSWLDETPAARLRLMAGAAALRDKDPWLDRFVIGVRAATPLHRSAWSITALIFWSVPSSVFLLVSIEMALER